MLTETFALPTIFATPNPIILSEESLDYENVLTFKVSKPGLAFWRTNEYTLQNVVVLSCFELLQMLPLLYAIK